MSKPRFVSEPELVDNIMIRCAQGLAPVDAARIEGVDRPLWKRWWARGRAEYAREEDSDYARLFKRVSKSYNSFVDAVELKFFEKFLTDDAKTDWRVYSWALARLRPERWGEAVAAGAGELPEEAVSFKDKLTADRDRQNLDTTDVSEDS